YLVIFLSFNISDQIYKFLITNPDSPILLPKFKDNSDSIKILTCGLKLNIAYTENGLLYSIPEKINFENKNIVDIKIGREHCLLLDTSGNVYAFGRGSRGQLGLGHLDEEYCPKLIEALAGIKITCIAAGGWHSAAVSFDGDLYMWGWNGNGQLGLSSQNISVMATPQVVDIQGYLDKKVLKVSCGNRHSIALLENNHLCGSGWNKYKQLKNHDEENYYNFIFISDFSKEFVDNIVCGSWNTAVICR
ncbi:RCC1 domain-containing protein 1, partial [Rhynchophorus ferrugineus]|uniref:RCC1 domain-containing protein 1 n=1 Tax=Rhynchophorus ferrugineus TaxID=354439 RepID=UPI003FCC87BC